MIDYRSPMSLLTCIVGLCVVCAALGYMAGFSSGYHTGARHATKGLVSAYAECIDGMRKP